MKVKVISLSYVFLFFNVLCFTRPRYQVSVYRTTGPLVALIPVSHAIKGLVTPANGYVPDGKRTKVCKIWLSGDKIYSSAAQSSRDRHVEPGS